MRRPAMRTFLFSDLRDYTVFIETRGDAAATRMLRASRRIVREAVAKHRGAEVKTEGDSFYVVFRSPSSAIRCAMDIQRANARHTQRHPDIPVRMGIGINTGEAMPHDKGYVGSAVILANRLSTAGRPGQILITDTVRSLVRTGAHAAMRDLGAWTLKGIAQPVRVYEVEPAEGTAARALGPALSLPAMLATPSRSVPGLVVCPELVQREAPLAALTQHLEAASKGEARIVALSGEGGIGKSRLGREIAELAHRNGMYVFGGRSHPSGPPYEPIVAALRPYAHARGTEILRRLLGPLVVELRRLLPEVEVGGSDPDIPSEERRDRFMRTINLLLEDAAAQRPVLLVLEDFHDADEASRGLLRYLASTFHAGICVVITYRDEEVGPAHPLRALLAELDRDRRLARVGLAPLDLAGVERMTAALVSGRDVRALARAVFERSEGIPFYVEELLKTALDDPGADPDRLALPRTIADSVRLRVARLVGSRGPGVADLLEAAAVAEVPLGYDLLIRLSDRDEGDAGADLSAAIEAQLLERPPTRSELYQFRHALTREAVAAGISPARKRRLHGRVAGAIEGEGDPASRAALLARHFAAAGDRPKALVYARQGAANAVRVGAYANAIDLLREAAAMASETADETVVLEELAAALRAAGEAVAAETSLRRARDLAARDGDVAGIARIDVRRAEVLLMLGRRAEAIAAARQAEGALHGERGETLAEALTILARVLRVENHLPEAADAARRALAVADELPAPRVRVGALAVLGSVLARLGDREGIGHLRAAIAFGRADGLDAEIANACLELIPALRSLGEWEEARLAAVEALDLARSRGLEFAQVRVLAELAVIHYTQGRYHDARAVAEQAVALARPGTTVATTTRSLLLHILSLMGEYETALQLYEQIAPEMERAEPDRRMGFLAARARALLGLGRVDEAWTAAQNGVDFVTAHLPRAGVDAFLVAADVAEARRDPAAARELLGSFDRHMAGRDAPPITVLREELRAIIEGIDGTAATESFTDVGKRYESLGVPVRATYRRAIGALARLARDPGRGDLREEVARFQKDLVDRGALYYVALIDRAVSELLPKRGEIASLVVGQDPVKSVSAS